MASTLRGRHRRAYSVLHPVAADAVHPASDSPGGCELKALRIAHPQPAAVVEALRAVGIDAEVASASEAALYATIGTPKGVIELH